MRTFKKITAFFLAVVMILAMNCTAFAAPGDEAQPASETTPNAAVAEHKFTAYQIFKGTISDDSLVAIQWGKNVDGETFLTALKASTDFGKTNPFEGIVYDADYPNRSADAVARVISGDAWKGDQPFEANDLARAFARIADTNKTGAGVEENGKLEAGYYLVVDDEVFAAGATNTVRNLSFLQMVSDGRFIPTVKVDVPTLTKEVKEVNDSEVVVTDQWGDVADYDIHDQVKFKLTGTLPEDYDSYKTYKYVFHDTLGAALERTAESTLAVKIDGTPVDKNDYDVAVDPEDPKHFTVTIANLKALTIQTTKDSKITVEYTAELTGNGIVYGGNGNENTAYLEYSNNPNQTGNGEPDTGTTPEDKVVVFTYQLIANKTKEDGTPLEGAKFQLFKYDADATSEDKYIAVGDVIKGVTTFEFKGVDAGKYKLVEIEAPEGYNKAEYMYFDIVATFDVTGQEVTDLKIASVNDKDGKPIVGADGKTPTFTFMGSAADGSLTSDIVNLQGILLPSTGGIGTTIFYVIGAILVVGAGVLLVIKKRMSKAE